MANQDKQKPRQDEQVKLRKGQGWARQITTNEKTWQKVTKRNKSQVKKKSKPSKIYKY